MTTVVMIDGERVPAERASVSVFDRGFLYGDSIFETLRTYRGIPFAVDAHLERLWRSAALVLIEVPVSRSILAEEVRRCAFELAPRESYVRVIVTRGSGPLGLDPDAATGALRILIAAPLRPPPERFYEEGVAVISYRTQRTAEGTPAASAKIGNYLVSVLATRAARHAGAEEALIVDAAGRVVEGASSNLFVIHGGCLLTAPEEAGILPGITRAWVLRLARSLGLGVELRAPTPAEVTGADEAFISSSIREIVPVVRCDGVSIGAGAPGPLTRRILETFRQLAREAPPF